LSAAEAVEMKIRARLMMSAIGINRRIGRLQSFFGKQVVTNDDKRQIATYGG